MQSNKLIKILSELSRKEMTRYREFAFSPYFNKHQGVRSLVKYLSEVYPRFDAKTCNRELLLSYLAKEGVTDQAKLALVFTYAFRLLEKISGAGAL